MWRSGTAVAPVSPGVKKALATTSVKRAKRLSTQAPHSGQRRFPHPEDSLRMSFFGCFWMLCALSEYMNMRLGQHEMAHRDVRRCAITQKWVETPSATKPFWQSLRRATKRRPRRRAAGNISGNSCEVSPLLARAGLHGERGGRRKPPERKRQRKDEVDAEHPPTAGPHAATSAPRRRFRAHLHSAHGGCQEGYGEQGRDGCRVW